MTLFIDACKDYGITWAHVDTYFGEWSWPNTSGQRARPMFNEARGSSSENAGHVRAGASEMLDGYLVFRSLVKTMIPPTVLLAERTSLFALCKILDCLATWPDAGQAPKLQRCVKSHMDAHVLAYPDSIMIPKFHEAMHLPLQLHKNNRALACFVHERKQKTFKQFAGDAKLKAGIWERSLTESLLKDTITKLSRDTPFRAGTYMVNTNTARHHSVACSVGDFIWCGDARGYSVLQIQSFDCNERDIGVIGRACSLRGDLWHLGGAVRVALTSMVGVGCWSMQRGGYLLLAPPCVAWQRQDA